mmetsp:Transcript_32920/g.97150  ORF Transcript_32920/g.97150 Transcript_32920/m.97150 type:complete len:164 (-) Transcript_32920:240-731(-)
MHHLITRLFIAAVAFLAAGVNAFVPGGVTSTGNNNPSASAPLPTIIQKPLLTSASSPHHLPERQNHVALRRQRQSVSSVQMQGLFGLGAPEIAIILVAAAVVLGPQKLADLTKDAGKMAGEYGKELKNVPDEFKKGYDETQGDIRAKKAKQMDPLPKDIEGSE